jgi:hypothetical protein
VTPTERAQVWQQHITDWEASGVSGSAYCKQQSLVYHQFVYWRQKLTPTEGSPKQDQAATGFARVVSVPRGLATRYDKLKRTYESVVAMACGFLWLPM